MTAARLTPTREALLRAIAAGEVSGWNFIRSHVWWWRDRWTPVNRDAWTWARWDECLAKPRDDGQSAGYSLVVLTDAGRALLAQADAR